MHCTCQRRHSLNALRNDLSQSALRYGQTSRVTGSRSIWCLKSRGCALKRESENNQHGPQCAACQNDEKQGFSAAPPIRALVWYGSGHAASNHQYTERHGVRRKVTGLSLPIFFCSLTLPRPWCQFPGSEYSLNGRAFATPKMLSANTIIDVSSSHRRMAASMQP
jgi:hypothetical protein